MKTKDVQKIKALQQEIATLKQLQTKGDLLLKKAKDMVQSLKEAQKLLQSVS